MKLATPEGEIFSSFLHECFVSISNRRNLLMQWHTLIPKERSYDSDMTGVFTDFISDILYEPLAFKMYKTHFTLFGTRWPVYRKWIKTSYHENSSNKEDDTWTYLKEHSKTLFGKRKECANDDYIYENPRNVNLNSVITIQFRRQLVRDFCWLVRDKKSDAARLHLIVALQSVLQKHPGCNDCWLSAIHEGCQGRIDLRFVPCFDITPEDVYDKKNKDQGE